MTTCKDCLHIGICPNLNHGTVADKCPDFKDRSRFVELPESIFVGAIIWWADSAIHTEPRKCEISTFSFYPSYDGKLHGWMNCVVCMPICPDSRSFRFESIGKTVFLTREEAEAELARRTANG